MARWLSLLMLLSALSMGAAEAYVDGPPVETHETAPPAEVPSAEAEEEAVDIASYATLASVVAPDPCASDARRAPVHCVPPVPPPR